VGKKTSAVAVIIVAKVTSVNGRQWRQCQRHDRSGITKAARYQRLQLDGCQTHIRHDLTPPFGSSGGTGAAIASAFPSSASAPIPVARSRPSSANGIVA